MRYRVRLIKINLPREKHDFASFPVSLLPVKRGRKDLTRKRDSKIAASIFWKLFQEDGRILSNKQYNPTRPVCVGALAFM